MDRDVLSALTDMTETLKGKVSDGWYNNLVSTMEGYDKQVCLKAIRWFVLNGEYNPRPAELLYRLRQLKPVPASVRQVEETPEERKFRAFVQAIERRGVSDPMRRLMLAAVFSPGAAHFDIKPSPSDGEMKVVNEALNEIYGEDF